MANIVKALFQTFKHYKLVDNALLNKWGMQNFRMKAAHRIYDRRKSYFKDSLKKEYDEIHTQGYFLKENYFDDETFKKVRDEVYDALNDKDITKIYKVYGNKTKELVQFEKLDKSRFPLLRGLQASPYLNDLFKIGERRDVNLNNENCYIERLLIADSNEHDVETDLHSDVFHHSFKAWIYITEVTGQHAPFVYVPGSHKLQAKRLKYVYRNSILPKPDKSRRIYQDEMDDFGYKEKIFTAKPNTLVVADTFGYHRRTDGSPGLERVGILFAARANPFWL